MVLIEDTKKFYQFFKHENPTEIRVFDKIRYPNGKSIFVKTEQEFLEQVEKYEKEGVSVYIGGRDRIKKGDKNVTYSDFIFFEIDEHDIKKPQQKEKVEALLREKGIQIGMSGFSGGGFHFYIPHKKKYFFTQEDRDFYKKVLNAFRDGLIENKIDIDSKVFNFERVSRVLGTLNTKRKIQSKILDYKLDVDREKNQKALREFILKFEKKGIEVDKNAVELLEKYNFNKTDKWLYDIIKNKVQIEEDTGANSVVFKNASIILTRENLQNEEIKIIGKALVDLCKDRTLTSFMGWIKKAKNNELAEVNEKEIDNFILEGKYNLSLYSNMKETDKPVLTEEIQLKTFADMKKLKKDKSFIVQDFLKPKSVTMIYSPPASFKSLLASSMAMAISNGKDWLKLKTKKQATLYLNGEMSEQIFKEYLEKLHFGMNLKRNNFPFYTLNNGLLLDSKKKVHLGFMVALEQAIEENDIKVLIFDTLHRFAFYDENRADDINILYTKVFKPLIEDYGISIVFLHHSTKKGDYRGSSDFLGAVDVCYSVIRQGKTGKFRIINEKSRSGEIQDITGEVNFGENFIKIIRGNEQVEQEKSLSKLKEVTEKIKSCFKVGVEMRRKDILDKFEIENFDYGSIKTIQRALKFLVDNQYLDKSKGVYNLILR